MAGGLMQLVLKGIENFYLTEEPQITFFKIIYKRHTNFSVESIPQFFNIKPDFSNRVSLTIAKNGDLINNIYIVVTLPAIPKLPSGGVVRWVNHIGYVLLKTIELEIGGKIVDKHYGEWLYINSELNKTNNNDGLNKMIGNVPELTEFTQSKDQYKLYIPLCFSFCKYKSSSLPIVALEFSETKINIEFNDISKCVIVGPSHYIYVKDSICLFEPYELIQINDTASYIQYIGFDNLTLKMGYIQISSNVTLMPNMKLTGLKSKYTTTIYDPQLMLYPAIKTNNPILNLTKSNVMFRNINNMTLSDGLAYVDYIYLDNMERMKFIKSNHDYLIDQLQFDNDKIISNTNNKIKVGYSHPTKEIIIRAQLSDINNEFHSDPFNFTTSVNSLIAKSLIKKIMIKLNGFDREYDYDQQFYTYLQSFEHHLSHPPLGLFIYSFALQPQPNENQPSGSCNFSKIDDISIDISIEPFMYTNQAKVRVYALSHNIFRIMNGIGELVFEN